MNSSCDGQCIGISASPSVLPMIIQGWLPLRLTGLTIGEGNGNPLQYSCLENPMDGGTWWAVVHGVARSQTRLSDFTLFFHFHALEKEMATHSSVLVWRISGTGEPGGLPSMGSHRVGHDLSNLAAAAAGLSIRDSQESSPVFSTIQKHHFLDAQGSLWFSTHIHTWLLEKP